MRGKLEAQSKSLLFSGHYDPLAVWTSTTMLRSELGHMGIVAWLLNEQLSLLVNGAPSPQHAHTHTQYPSLLYPGQFSTLGVFKQGALTNL